MIFIINTISTYCKGTPSETGAFHNVWNAAGNDIRGSISNFVNHFVNHLPKL